MINEFQNFRKKWENKAKSENFKLDFVSNNNSFVGGFINDMIFEHIEDYPLPSNGYMFYDITSEQRGLLMIVDPEFLNKFNNFGKRIRKLFDVPDQIINNCASDHQILLSIQSKKFILKEEKKEDEEDEEEKEDDFISEEDEYEYEYDINSQELSTLSFEDWVETIKKIEQQNEISNSTIKN